MKTINLENFKETENEIFGIFENYNCNSLDITKASKSELIECADAFESTAEIAEIIFENPELRAATDKAYQIALKRFEEA